MADDAPVHPSGSAADIPQFDGTVDGSARKPGDGDTATVQPAMHTAVISMDSRSNEAETLFRTAIVALEGIPGDQVEGISPLYHVSHLHGSDAMSAVMQMTCRMDAKALIATLGSVEESLNGDVDLDLVDMPGTVCDEPDCRVPWPSARTHASVLAPWMGHGPAGAARRRPGVVSAGHGTRRRPCGTAVRHLDCREYGMKIRAPHGGSMSSRCCSACRGLSACARQ